MHGLTWAMVASALAAPVLGDPGDRALARVADEVATDPDRLRPAVAEWAEAGGDLRSARDLLIAGGRRGCTGPCAPALLHAARDAAMAGADPGAVVLEAVDDAVGWRLVADRVVTDAELGYAVRAETARRLLGW